ncbi:MAG: magnesium transporter [Clostridia bacterium]|nr:magnesium transporter [Clostridia bacterium]
MSDRDERSLIEEEKIEHPDYAEELINMLQSDIDLLEKKERLADYHANDIADVLPLLTKERRMRLYRLIGEDAVSEVFTYLEDPAEYIKELDIEKAADIVENMDADDAVDVLEDLDKAQKDAILEHMDEESRRDIDLIQSYDEDEIGSRMTTNYISITRGFSVKQAMRALVRQAADNDNLQTIYVLNRDQTFYGAISLQDLIIARESTDLDDLITTSYPFVYDNETVAECIEELKDYSEDSIPVLSRDRILLGVITSTDLIEVVDEEMGEDYVKLAGLTEEEDLNEPLAQSMKKRISWLLILMVLGLMVSSVIGLFEPVMSSMTILVAFQSLVLAMAGNCGTQSLGVTIRILSDEELTLSQKTKLVMKEGMVGLCNGMVVGCMALIFCGLYIHLGKQMAWGTAFQVSGCIGAAMMLAMFISGIGGTVIPLFFNKIHVDPAVASGPLITTVNDLVAVVSYYGLAWLFLIKLMHLG